MEAIFETNPVFLSSLLGDLKTGKIQLPDFHPRAGEGYVYPTTHRARKAEIALLIAPLRW
jgi:hypothetical protein